MTKEKIEIDSNIVRFGKGGYISLDDFPNRFSATINAFDKEKCIRKNSNYRTFSVEKEGARLAKNKFADKKATSLFIDNVLGWGGSYGNLIRAKIKHFKSRGRIIKSIPVAARFLNEGEFQKAINKIILPKPCGLDVSFGSKILRMLNPEKVGVYDSVLYEHLPYPYTIPGWDEFCRDCKAVAEELERRGIKNPERKNGKWFVADVEVVIFGHYWKSNKS